MNIAKFKLFGTEVSVHWTVLIPLVFLMMDYGLMGIATWGILYASILLHEFGHTFASRSFGNKCDRMLLMVLGGVAISDGFSRDPMRRFLTYLAGPAVSFGLALLAFIAFVVIELTVGLPHSIINGPIWMVLILDLFVINVMLFVFNILPIYPLDGGGMVHSANLARKHNEIEACKSTARTSIVFAGLGIIWAVSHVAIMMVIIFVLAIYMNYKLYANGEHSVK